MRYKELYIALSSIVPCALTLRRTTAALSMDKELEFQQLLEKMELDVLAFRDRIEGAYDGRCSLETLRECGRGNYDPCTSVYPAQMCMQKEELIISDCGDGTECNALWDKTVSSVRMPSALARGANGNPTDPEIIETVCYSLQAEEHMSAKYQEDIEYWSQWGVTPSWTYFGAHNGMFRIHPSTQTKTCGVYDPRRRPWYVAASSGPKDVVMIIDVSGSMTDYGRIDLARDVGKTIVETLTVADRVAVVAFSENAELIGGQDRLIRATKQNKDKLLNAISSLSPKTATNFYAGFEKAFDSLDATISYESTTGCNIAVLFLTDGMITAGPNKGEVITLVNDRTAQIASKWERDVYIFTYSLGYDADHDVTKAIACQTGGLWTPVEDVAFGGDLVSSMSSYYKLFALGLGEGDNADFTAWVEPYVFYTAGKMGTTVSTPVYDRNVDPPLFLGVVAIDSYMDALEQVSGEDATSSAMLNRFVRVSTARCPRLSLTECELDALRYLGGGDRAKCNLCNNTEFVGIVPEKCRGVSDYPRNLWKNTDVQGQSYEDRACCEVGGAEPSDVCPASVQGLTTISTGAIVGIAVVFSVIVVVACTCIFLCLRSISKKDQTSDSSDFDWRKYGGQISNQQKCQSQQPIANASVSSLGTPYGGASVSGSQTAYEGVSIALPPSVSPSYTPSAPLPSDHGKH